MIQLQCIFLRILALLILKYIVVKDKSIDVHIERRFDMMIFFSGVACPFNLLN